MRALMDHPMVSLFETKKACIFDIIGYLHTNKNNNNNDMHETHEKALHINGLKYWDQEADKGGLQQQSVYYVTVD